MKTCSKCGENKEEFEYAPRGGKRKDLCAYCKECASIYSKEYRSREGYREKFRSGSINRNKKLREWIASMKEAEPCMDCGNYYPFYAMQYDHRSEFKKKYDISKMCNGRSKKSILEEISKCDLVCANCHAGRTYKQNLIRHGKEAINV